MDNNVIKTTFTIDAEPINTLKSSVKCPKCGESYYQKLYSSSTCMYFPPIYKNGVNINPDRNKIATHCKCINCGEYFSY